MSEIDKYESWISLLEARGEWLCAAVIRNDMDEYISRMYRHGESSHVRNIKNKETQGVLNG